MDPDNTPIITQKAIDQLLSDISLKDKIINKSAVLQKTLGELLSKTPSRDLIMLKKNFNNLIRIIEEEEAFTENFKSEFIKNFRHLSFLTLNTTTDYKLFESAVKLENMISLLLYDVEKERREYPRFPYTGDCDIKIADEEFKVYSSDISCGGINFFSPFKIEKNSQCSLKIKADKTYHLGAKILRVEGLLNDNPIVYGAGASFDKELQWEHLQIIVKNAVF